MEVFALYGPSGTGKSDSSLLFAYQNYIPAIIDDGLLIFKGIKYAGFSAKYEKNKMTAIKRATFFYDDHVAQVKSAIHKLELDKILLLGTSKKMVQRISDRLELGGIDHWVSISDIRSARDIEKALVVRKTEGKHVIPIPYVQIDQSFFNKVITRGIKIFTPQKEVIGETTVVQPNFHNVNEETTVVVQPHSQMGSITIALSVLNKMIKLSCMSFTEIENYDPIQIELGRFPVTKLHVSINYSPQLDLIKLVKKLQKKIHQDFQHYLGIEIRSIDIVIKKIVIPKTKLLN